MLNITTLCSCKKVALLGNMNNNLFNLTRYLRDEGFEAVLYVFPYDPVHFLPEADTFDDGYKTFARFPGWGNPYELNKTSSEEIRKELDEYDFIIGCGTSPAYLSMAGIALDLFTPYGSDLYHFPFFNIFHPRKLLSYIAGLFQKRKEIQQLPSRPGNIKGYIPFVIHQRRGIREAANCAVLTSGNDIYGQSLRKLGYRNRHFLFSVPMIYASQYNKDAIAHSYAKSSWYKSFKEIRDKYNFVVFHNCRHCWKYEKDPASFKGNDRLLKGFAQFRQKYPGKGAIITFEYGTDVPESKKLALELGIEADVHWFPLMARKELLIGMSLSDLVVGNLSDASWATYGVVYESMAVSKPIMHHREDELYHKETLYPMINAYSSNMVSKSLLYYFIHRDELITMGLKANEWFIRSCINEPVDQIVELINSKQS